MHVQNLQPMKYILTLSLSLFICLTLQAYNMQNPKDSISLESYMKANDVAAQKSKDGIYYIIEKEGRGAKAKKGDYVMINYTGKLVDGTVFDQSDEKDPFTFQVGYRQVIQGFDKGIPLLKVGSKATLYIPSELGYGKAGIGNSIPSNAGLIFDVEVLKIMDLEEYDKYMRALEQKERALYEKHVADQFKADKKIIHEYAADHKIKTKRTKSGLSYAITTAGKGQKAKPGDILTVEYEGFLVDDTPFDSSPKKTPYQFELGKRKVIDGWEEGMQYFNKGSEGWIIVPSKMAYGPRAIEEDNISIPGDAVLVFKIKVIDINSPNK